MIILYILGVVLGLFLAYVIFLSICALAVNPKREYNADSPFYRAVLNSATAFVLRLVRVRVHLNGGEKIPKNGPLLFVGNHRSNYDPIVTWYALKKWNLAFISKEGNFKIPFFGRIIRKCCFLSIDRENPRNAITTINKAATLLREGTVNMGVYPEGTRSKSGELLPFHNGVFKIAQKADCPVVVLAVRGTEQVHSRTPFRKTNVYLDVLEVLPADWIKSNKTDIIGSRVSRMLEEHLSD